MQIATPDFVMIQKFQGSDCLHYICTGEKCNAYDTPAVRAIKSHIIYFSQKTKEHAISSEKEFFFSEEGARPVPGPSLGNKGSPSPSYSTPHQLSPSLWNPPILPPEFQAD